MSRTRLAMRGVALAAAAMLVWAPMAQADDPIADGTDQGNQDEKDKQDDQNPAGDIVDRVTDGLDQAGRQAQQNQQNQGQQPGQAPPGKGFMHTVNGVPTCIRGGETFVNVHIEMIYPVERC